MAELHELTIAEAARLIAARNLSPVELTEACLFRIEALDDQLQSVVLVTADRARRAARDAEAAIHADGPRGALHGIPYCLKDIYDVAGLRTTAQSRLLASMVHPSSRGRPPDLARPPPGCAASPRCSRRMARCDAAVPPLAPQVPGRLTACFHPFTEAA